MHAGDDYSRRGNFGGSLFRSMVLVYSPDGTNVYGSSGGEFDGYLAAGVLVRANSNYEASEEMSDHSPLFTFPLRNRLIQQGVGVKLIACVTARPTPKVCHCLHDQAQRNSLPCARFFSFPLSCVALPRLVSSLIL